MRYIVTHIDNVNASAEIPNWPQLLSKTVDDLSRIARTEMELTALTLKRFIEGETDKIVGLVFLLVGLLYGSVFLAGGIVLLIHLWLAWWLSLLIVGGLIASAGILVSMVLKAAATRKSM